MSNVKREASAFRYTTFCKY